MAELRTPWLLGPPTGKLTRDEHKARRELRRLEQIIEGWNDETFQRQFTATVTAVAHAGGTPRDVVTLVVYLLRSTADHMERSYVDEVIGGIDPDADRQHG